MTTRPLLRYHGGKWQIGQWIISHFPSHRVYVEPYGGAASVLLQKPRAYTEVVNDLDGEIINLFRVVRDRGDELKQKLSDTPFARKEYELSFIPCNNELEQARRTAVRSHMGFGSNALCRNIHSGFRANSNQSGTSPAHDWANFPAALSAITERLRGVVIEQRDALSVMRHQDSPNTLHYCDPPYVHETRSDTMHGHHGYTHEMTDDQHAEMIEVLRGLSGMVILSGYACDLYDTWLSDWSRVERYALADGSRPRLEVLWLNPRCAQLQRRMGSLFDTKLLSGTGNMS